MSQDRYEIGISSMDEYAANRIAAIKAREGGMPQTGERHDKLAVHLQNAERWMMANCPPGCRVACAIVFEFVPDVNPVYVGERDIYAQKGADNG